MLALVLPLPAGQIYVPLPINQGLNCCLRGDNNSSSIFQLRKLRACPRSVMVAMEVAHRSVNDKPKSHPHCNTAFQKECATLCACATHANRAAPCHAPMPISHIEVSDFAIVSMLTAGSASCSVCRCSTSDARAPLEPSV